MLLPTALSGAFVALSVGRAGDRPADGETSDIETSRWMNGFEMGGVTDGLLGRGTPALLIADTAEEESGATGSTSARAEPVQVAKGSATCE